MQENMVNKEELKRQQVDALEMQWQFRYRRYLHHANVATYNEGTQQSHSNDEDWFKVYYLIGDFMAHCTKIVKEIAHKGPDLQPLDPFDHRFILKLKNESIYYKDNIVIRLARIVKPNPNKPDEFISNLPAQLFYQQFNANDIINDVLIDNYKTKQEKDDPSPKLHVPLCCIVEYMGYRAFCQADTLFHGYDTVAYGPCSEAEFRPNKRVQSFLYQIGNSLNLKPYKVQNRENNIVKIPFSLKCQVHYFKSQKYQPKMKIIHQESDLYDVWEKNQKREEYYLYGLSRMWPHFVDKGLQNNFGWLRAETVRRSPYKLDSSAFLGFAAETEEESELQLADLCKRIQDDLTTQFADELDKGETRYFKDILGIEKIHLIDSHSVITAFHERGINLRFMGNVANKSQMAHIKTILKTQMVAKVLKNIFYSVQDATSPNIRQNLVDFLNLIFQTNEESHYFYKTKVYPQILDYFKYNITEFPLSIPGGGLLHAIMYHFGVDIHIIQYAFFIDQERPPFSQIAVNNFNASADSFHFDTSEPKMIANLFRKKIFLRDDPERQYKLNKKLKQINIMINFYKGRRSKETACKGPYPESYYYSEAADILAQLNRFDDAFKYAEIAIKLIPEKHSRLVNPLCVMMKYYSIKNQIVKCLQVFDRALAAIAYHLGQNHPLYITVFNVMGHEYFRSGDTEKCQKILRKSLDICSLTLGTLHIKRSDILKLLSQLQTIPHITSVEYLTQALLILQYSQAATEQIKDVCKMIAQQHKAIGDNKNMLHFAKRSGDLVLQIQAAQRNEQHKFIIQLCERYKSPDQQTQKKQGKIIDVVAEQIMLVFLFKACFKANLSILNRESVNRMKKYYIALKDFTMYKSKEGLESLKYDMKANNYTVMRLMDECISSLMSRYMDAIAQKEFYNHMDQLALKSRDNTNVRAYKVYLAIIDMHTQVEIESLFAMFV